jgi:hypothetical protein
MGKADSSAPSFHFMSNLARAIMEVEMVRTKIYQEMAFGPPQTRMVANKGGSVGR